MCARFLDAFQSDGKARLKFKVFVTEDDKMCVQYPGVYVARLI